jgi:hypothetical protein
MVCVGHIGVDTDLLAAVTNGQSRLAESICLEMYH